MPDEVGGQPFPDGERPDSQNRGAADEAFAAVVLDEKFVEAAEIHEPSAAERILYAALERAESEAPVEHSFYSDGPESHVDSYGESYPCDEDPETDPDADDEGRFDRSDYTRYLPDEDQDQDQDQDRPCAGDLGYGAYCAAPGAYGAAGATAGDGRRPWGWQRPVACVLALVMGISIVAMALIAVQRMSAGQRQDTGPLSPTVEPGVPPVMQEAEPSDEDP